VHVQEDQPSTATTYSTVADLPEFGKGRGQNNCVTCGRKKKASKFFGKRGGGGSQCKSCAYNKAPAHKVFSMTSLTARESNMLEYADDNYRDSSMERLGRLSLCNESKESSAAGSMASTMPNSSVASTRPGSMASTMPGTRPGSVAGSMANTKRASMSDSEGVLDARGDAVFEMEMESSDGSV
jgi:hypothetical protein